jgi:hypothetical protein
MESENDHLNTVTEPEMNENKNSFSEDKKSKSYLELILKYKNKIHVNYGDYDFNKAETSPRMLFKKRRPDKLEYMSMYGNEVKPTDKTMNQTNYDNNIPTYINNMINCPSNSSCLSKEERSTIYLI